MNAHSSFHNPDAVPSDGDISKCMNCGHEYVRHGDRWQPMTAAERAELEPEVLRELETLEYARIRSNLPDLTKRDGRT